VPLIASHYSRRDPVPKVLHEHVLFYQTFGLRLRDDNGETADHLLNELEFLARLTRLQDAAPDDERARPIRAAKRDFLARHTADWVPRAAKAAGRFAPPLYAFLLRLLAAWSRRDLEEQAAWLSAPAPRRDQMR
jgi:TorA maturation chaperone TorD